MEEGNTSLGSGLSLDLLEEDTAFSLEELTGTADPAEQLAAQMKKQAEPEMAKQTNNNSSEPVKPAESVAGEEGGTDPGKKSNATESKSSPSDDMSQIYSSLATHLHSSGVLSNLNPEEPVKSFADLQKAIKSEIQTGLTETQRAYKEAMEAGVPQSKFVAYEKAMSQLNSITPEVIAQENNSVLRGKVIAQDFMNRGFDREEAEKYAKRSIDLGEDIQDAEKAIGRIKEFTAGEFEKEKLSLKKEEEDVNKNIKEFIDKKNEFITGIKIDDNTKERLFKQITTPIARDKEGNPLSKYGKALKDSPEQVRTTVEYLFMITDGFKDFSKLNNSIETAKTKDLDTVLKNNVSSFTQGDGKASFKDTQTNFLMDDIMLDV